MRPFFSCSELVLPACIAPELDVMHWRTVDNSLVVMLTLRVSKMSKARLDIQGSYTLRINIVWEYGTGGSVVFIGNCARTEVRKLTEYHENGSSQIVLSL